MNARPSLLRRLLVGALSVLLALVAGLAALAWMVGRPDPARWTVPVRVLGLTLHVPVAAGLRFATSPLGGRLLDGRLLPTPAGLVRVHWDEARAHLRLECAPCRVDLPTLSARPVLVPSASATVHRSVGRLWGEVVAGPLRGRWRGALTEQDLSLDVRIGDTPVADLYALFASEIPEARSARIEGRFAARLTVVLPAGGVHVEPEWRLDRVRGLGTEALRGLAPQPSCAEEDERPAASLLATVRTPVFSRAARRPSAAGGRAALESAVVAAEDQRFYEHHGIDPDEMRAALAANDARQGIARGGSTLTQQLARLLFAGSDRSLTRKLREALYAVEMEDTLGKAQILDLYLAVAPWGPGVCGAEPAARHYFGKPVARLSTLEAAWLAALLRNPAQAGTAPIAFVERTRWVVDGMVDLPRSERRAAAAELETLGAVLRGERPPSAVGRARPPTMTLSSTE